MLQLRRSALAQDDAPNGRLTAHDPADVAANTPDAGTVMRSRNWGA